MGLVYQDAVTHPALGDWQGTMEIYAPYNGPVDLTAPSLRDPVTSEPIYSFSDDYFLLFKMDSAKLTLSKGNRIIEIQFGGHAGSIKWSDLMEQLELYDQEFPYYDDLQRQNKIDSYNQKKRDLFRKQNPGASESLIEQNMQRIRIYEKAREEPQTRNDAPQEFPRELTDLDFDRAGYTMAGYDDWDTDDRDYWDDMDFDSDEDSERETDDYDWEGGSEAEDFDGWENEHDAEPDPDLIALADSSGDFAGSA